jgi:hypothetical protein
LCASNWLPYAQFALTKLIHANFANLPKSSFTNEKSEKSKKAILTPSIGPQSNLKQHFLVLNQSKKSLLA